MEALGAMQSAEQKVLGDIRAVAGKLRGALHNDPGSVGEAAALLWDVRKICYEELNQIQHEYLALQTVIWLTRARIVAPNACWTWNPRQTGTAHEPDLQASVGGRILLSGEVTASEKPVGTIRQRMIRTLAKLHGMPGLHYYVVRNPRMAGVAEQIAADVCPDARVVALGFDALNKRHLAVPLKAVQDVDLPHTAESEEADAEFSESN